jgi:type IV secretory pathway TrbD component
MSPDRPTNVTNGRIFTIVSFVASFITVLGFGLLFAALAAIFAVMAIRRGDPMGRNALIVSAIAAIGYVVVRVLIA